MKQWLPNDLPDSCLLLRLVIMKQVVKANPWNGDCQSRPQGSLLSCAKNRLRVERDLDTRLRKTHRDTAVVK